MGPMVMRLPAAHDATSGTRHRIKELSFERTEAQRTSLKKSGTSDMPTETHQPPESANKRAEHVDQPRAHTTLHVGPLETLRAAIQTACRLSIPLRWSCGDHDTFFAEYLCNKKTQLASAAKNVATQAKAASRCLAVRRSPKLGDAAHRLSHNEQSFATHP